MITTLALLTILISTLLVLSNLRDVMSDTLHALEASARRAHDDGILVQKLAFATLWIMIFALCYL